MRKIQTKSHKDRTLISAKRFDATICKTKFNFIIILNTFLFFGKRDKWKKMKEPLTKAKTFLKIKCADVEKT